jgi:hypothetical protein
LAKAADQVRASDVTLWGLVALAAWSVAVLSANVAGLVPAEAFAALHQSRLEGASLTQVRAQLTTLDNEATRLRRENALLVQRFALAETAQTEATRRIGALETSLPTLLEAIPERAALDPATTAALGGGKAVSFETDGGSVRVEQRPLLGIEPSPPFPVPPPDSAAAAVAADAFGVALGFPVAEGDTEAQWQNMLAKVGTLLIGLWPVVTDAEGSDGKLVVAGPLATRAQAAELCDRLDRVGIPCEPVPFAGEPLPILN